MADIKTVARKEISEYLKRLENNVSKWRCVSVAVNLVFCAALPMLSVPAIQFRVATVFVNLVLESAVLYRNNSLRVWFPTVLVYFLTLPILLGSLKVASLAYVCVAVAQGMSLYTHSSAAKKLAPFLRKVLNYAFVEGLNLQKLENAASLLGASSPSKVRNNRKEQELKDLYTELEQNKSLLGGEASSKYQDCLALLNEVRDALIEACETQEESSSPSKVRSNLNEQELKGYEQELKDLYTKLEQDKSLLGGEASSKYQDCLAQLNEVRDALIEACDTAENQL